MRPTGLHLSRSIIASGPMLTTGIRELKDIAIIKRSGLWERSGLRLSLSCGEIINRTMKTITWRTSRDKGCASLREKNRGGVDKFHRKSLPQGEREPLILETRCIQLLLNI